MIEQLSLNIGTFLITYFIHSGVFIIAALTAIKFKKLASDRLGEYVLKSALILGIITTAIQESNLMLETNIKSPLTYQWKISSTKPQQQINPVITPVANKQKNLFSNKLQKPESQNLPVPMITPTQTDSVFEALSWATWFMIAWFIFTFKLLSQKITQWHQLKIQLKQRKLLINNDIKHIFTKLVQQSQLKRQVIISESHTIDSPIALSNHEIVLPTNFHKKYEIEQVKAALAHELAHIKRFDGHWLWLGFLIESVFFIQPLNRLINKQIYQLAELRSDQLATQWTGNPRALAETLSQVARNTFNNNSIQMVPAMKSNKSDLRIRIENLIFNNNNKTASLSIIVITLLCAVVLIVAPGVSINTANAWSFSEKNSRSIHIDDNGKSKVTINSIKDGKNFKLKATLNGHIDFNDDESKIINFPQDSSFDLTIVENGVKRRILIKSDDSNPSYTYYLNGDINDFDKNAQNWFASVIPEVLRTTDINANKLVERISRAKGSEAYFNAASSADDIRKKITERRVQMRAENTKSNN